MTGHVWIGGGRTRVGRGSLIALGLTVLLAGVGLAAPAGADEGFRCELKEARGVAAPDAQTATELVCGELRRVSGARGAYAVELRTLGELVVVTASREEPPGSVTMQVHGVEEILTAAPRIADALVRGLGFATTQRVDNLLVEETRPARVKKGSVKFSLGVADVESPGFGARSAGFSLGLVYSTPRFALPAELRFDWDDAPYPGKSLDLFSVSVGGRGYLSKKDVSPFVGAGLGVLHLSANGGLYGEEGYFSAEKSGVAPYLEAGVEMLRLHRGRIALLVRADFPLGSLESPAIAPYSYSDPVTGYHAEQPGRPAESRYVVPVSIGVSVMF
jgi:hypothetical protein